MGSHAPETHTFFGPDICYQTCLGVQNKYYEYYEPRLLKNLRIIKPQMKKDILIKNRVFRTFDQGS